MYVHQSCLRRWQRMVLVSQPTHPALYTDDARHLVCNVCKQPFTNPPPTRHELMASFTGPALAALVDTDCIIAAHDAFSDQLTEQISSLGALPDELLERVGMSHWVRGVYLITDVTPEDEDCGKDHVCAVNLTRPLSTTSRQVRLEERARALALEKEKPSSAEEDEPITVEHFAGGPCLTQTLTACIVVGGGGRGWTTLVARDGDAPLLAKALNLAGARLRVRCEGDGGFHRGQAVELHGLQARADLNGCEGILLRFDAAAKRWMTRLADGSGKALRPTNLAPVVGLRDKPAVLAFWGDAQWSRTQLLAELARGHWGLCRASVADFIATSGERRAGLDERLVFAPRTAMTSESYAVHQMQAERGRNVRELAGVEEEEEMAR